MNHIAVTNGETMSSLDLLTVLNAARADHGESEVRRNDFVARIRDELEGEHYETFVVANANGTQSMGAMLTHDQCFLVLMRESKAVRRQALARIKAKAAQPVALPNYTEALRQLADQIERNEQQAAALTIATPKAEALDRLAAADGSMCITDAAKSIGIKPKALFAWLMAHEWIYRRPGKASYLAYQTRIQQGVLEHKVTTVQRDDGTDKVCEQVQVTPKGLARLSLEVRAV
jgi:phage antirepressor YoqD-like protein